MKSFENQAPVQIEAEINPGTQTISIDDIGLNVDSQYLEDLTFVVRPSTFVEEYELESFEETELEESWQGIMNELTPQLLESYFPEAIAELTNSPLHEGGAGLFINRIEAKLNEVRSQNIPDLSNLFELLSTDEFQRLRSYLDIPTIPDEFIGIDLKNNKKNQKSFPEDVVEKINLYADQITSRDQLTQFIMNELANSLVGHHVTNTGGIDTSRLLNKVQQIWNTEEGISLAGIEESELKLLNRRLRFSRDLKVKAAQVQFSSIDNSTRSEDQTLPNGITIRLSSGDFDEAILDQSNWEQREQFKDRAYEVVINGKKYLLKERKTRQHRDTKMGGGIYSQPSQDEFIIAEDLNENGRYKLGPVENIYEEPILVVTFPGDPNEHSTYQFCLYEFEEGVTLPIEGNKVTSEIIEKELVEILRYDPITIQEYDSLKEAIHQEADSESLEIQEMEGLLEQLDAKDKTDEFKAILESRLTELNTDINGFKGMINQNIESIRNEQIDFEEFIRIKSILLVKLANSLSRTVNSQLGYENSDLDGFGFVFNRNGVPLSIFNFDFEYYALTGKREEIDLKPTETAERTFRERYERKDLLKQITAVKLAERYTLEKLV